MGLKEGLKLSLTTSLIDSRAESQEIYRPNFLYNDYSAGTKVLVSLINELNSCKEFIFSIAFITNSGIITLLNTLLDLENRGIKGKILTSNYLGFNEASALRRLKEFSNIELKVCDSKKIHNKGYIFKRKDSYSLIIGSSNLTQEALTSNHEWNLKIFSLEEGKLINDVLGEFNKVWNHTPSLTNEWIDEYERLVKRNNYSFLINSIIPSINQEINPNTMQKEALASLLELRKAGKRKALVISATGTGKTYLAAFDVKSFNPRRMLFVVHREQIAKDALASFKRICGDNKKMSVLSGNNKNLDSDYIFSTIQTLSKENILEKLPSNHFDYICIDEVHHAGAESYIKIINHFNPQFMMGMSATPERTDRYNIYELFDYNIAYEIRLQKALEADMLTPFHYFGIRDILINGVQLDEDVDIRHLVSKERVNNIIDKLIFYGYSGSRPKGLIFCSRTRECEELSRLFNQRGYKTIALTGANTIDEREYAIDCLEQNERNDEALDYIFTVDVFNEGIDIIKVNQIIMLRPTQSAIIFVQQLGRGLRKSSEKEYVVVLDFIANYKKNFLIPIALSGNRTYNKDAMRKYVSNGAAVIPGASTINFDRITKENIYKAISNAKFTNLTFLKKEYLNLKQKLNKVPTLLDFYNYGSVDPEIILSYTKSYYKFLIKVEDDYNRLTSEHIEALDYLSTEIGNGKRCHELIILNELLKANTVKINHLINKNIALEDIKSACKTLDTSFQNNKRVNSFIEVIDNKIKISEYLYNLLNNKEFNNQVKDLVNYALTKNLDEYSNIEEDNNFVLYKKYGRKDVLRLLNWDKDETSTVYGYKVKHHTCPIFVTYHKKDDISETTKYEDEFVDNAHFSWMSRSRRTLYSNEIQKIINYKENNIKLYLFIKKDDDEGKEFYYLGKVKPIKWVETTILDNHRKSVPIVNFTLKLNHPVQEDIYNYIIEKGIIDEERT